SWNRGRTIGKRAQYRAVAEFSADNRGSPGERQHLPLFGATNRLAVMLDRLRAADEIALHLVAGFGRQERELRLGLDALRHHRQLEAAAQTDDRADDRRRLRIVLEIGDEGLVDLDLVERKGLQIGQRRIAGAEIVHGDANVEVLEAAQDRQ